jgi:hypothetical protein
MEAFQIAVMFIVELVLDEHCANAFLQFVAVIFLIMAEALLLTFNGISHTQNNFFAARCDRKAVFSMPCLPHGWFKRRLWRRR